MDMENLIRLIGWFASVLETPVLYVTPFFSTSQIFKVMEAHSIWVYDKLKKRKRKVTLRVPSKVKRDRTKTKISTFVNFIHQKDAYITMCVVKKIMDRRAPIYTVHDNFITNSHNCKEIPIQYLENLVLHAKDYGKDVDVQALQETSFSEMVVSKDLIDKLFLDILPEHIKNYKQRLKVWNANVSRFKTYYYGYPHSVCCKDPRCSGKDMK
ncbi:putative DNA-directed RNA polymerase [Bienertia sinuspersici]